MIREKDLIDTIVEGILEKKGKEIVVIDLSAIHYAFCDTFIICHGDSSTQVGAIAKSVEEKMKMTFNIRVSHLEGMQNSQWVLMDFHDIVVHIFQKEYRDHYKLEDLWGDAQQKRIEEE